MKFIVIKPVVVSGRDFLRMHFEKCGTIFGCTECVWGAGVVKISSPLGEKGGIFIAWRLSRYLKSSTQEHNCVGEGPKYDRLFLFLEGFSPFSSLANPGVGRGVYSSQKPNSKKMKSPNRNDVPKFPLENGTLGFLFSGQAHQVFLSRFFMPRPTGFCIWIPLHKYLEHCVNVRNRSGFKGRGGGGAKFTLASMALKK